MCPRTPTACSTRSAGSPAASPCYVKDGVLCYEYNLFEIERTKIKAKDKLASRQGEDRSRVEADRQGRLARWTSP